jgi:phospholipase C
MERPTCVNGETEAANNSYVSKNASSEYYKTSDISSFNFSFSFVITSDYYLASLTPTFTSVDITKTQDATIIATS